MLIRSPTPYGPPVTTGPTIGLASTNGAAEAAGSGTGKHGRAGTAVEEPVPEETVPRGAGKDQGGLQIRVRGRRP